MKRTLLIKRSIVALALIAAVLGLQIEIKKDYDGNLSLEGLKTTEARAATSEGLLLAYACKSGDIITGYGNECALVSTSWCIPNACK
jgi:hypothetical protein